MRRNYISPEFKLSSIPGTYNSSEESHYFGSKMMDIEDSININDVDVIYYHSKLGEQNDDVTDILENSVVWSSLIEKNKNHTLDYDMWYKSINKKWSIKIDSYSLLSGYIYSKIKESKTFYNLKVNDTLNNDISLFIKEYINKNIMNRYMIDNVQLYVRYKDISDNTFISILSDEYLVKKVNLIKSIDDREIIINFNSDKPSDIFSFDYYYNISYRKI